MAGQILTRLPDVHYDSAVGQGCGECLQIHFTSHARNLLKIPPGVSMAARIGRSPEDCQIPPGVFCLRGKAARWGRSRAEPAVEGGLVHPGGGKQVGVHLLDVRGVEPGPGLGEGGNVLGLELVGGL
jgi:hypothetical protein